MTDELKPCLAYPCDGHMKGNSYDVSLECSSCQFVVADDEEYAALVAGKQAAIDAALESVVQAILNKGSVSISAGLPSSSGYCTSVDIIRSRIGTNPLAEAQAKLEFANQHNRRMAQIQELDAASIVELQTTLAEAQARIAELEDLLGAGIAVQQMKKIATLTAQLAEAKKDADSYRSQLNQVLEMTMQLDEHPEGYDGPCACKLCQSY